MCLCVYLCASVCMCICGVLCLPVWVCDIQSISVVCELSVCGVSVCFCVKSVVQGMIFKCACEMCGMHEGCGL